MKTSVAHVGLTIGKIKASVSSLMGSVSYLKAFIPIAVTNIIHNRVQYEQYLFESHKLKLVPYKTFSKRIPKKHELFNVHHWLNDAIRDLDNKYIKELYFIISNKETKEIVEQYTFSIEYIKTPDKPKLKHKMAEVLEETSEILKTINSLGQKVMLDKENISYAVQIVLNDDAPEEYVIKNFERDTTPYIDPTVLESVTIGKISTGYHKFEIHGKGEIFKAVNVQPQESTEVFDTANFGGEYTDEIPPIEIKGDENVVTESSVNTVHNDSVEISEPVGQSTSENPRVSQDVFKKPFPKKRKAIESWNAATELVRRKKSNGNLEEIFCTIKQEERGYSEDTISIGEIETFSTSSGCEQDNEISCVCGIKYKIPMVTLTVCSICAKYQHVACVGYKSRSSVPKPHICYYCFAKTGTKMSDIRMYSARTDEVRAQLATMRLVSFFCYKTKQGPKTITDLIPATSQQKINKEMLKYKMVKEINNELVLNIDNIKLALNSNLFYKGFNPAAINSDVAISIDD